MIDLTPKTLKKIEFTVPGEPNQKRSPSNMRFKKKDGSEIWRPVKNKQNTPVEGNIQQWYMHAVGDVERPHEGPVALRVRCYFEIRVADKNSWRGPLYETEQIYHTSKPDLDRLSNMVQDALTGVAWKDDCQIALAPGSGKWYSPRPRTEVTIWLLALQVPATQKEYKALLAAEVTA
jgi:Holliday junction resolvase